MFDPLPLNGLILVSPRRFSDPRGVFSETFVRERYREGGIDADFMQDNQSVSSSRGVVRGLHFQSPPFAQAKLVRCSYGAILDVAVDIRRGSSTYGQHLSVQLTAESGQQLYVPAGYAHGFCTLSDMAIVDYKVDAPYAPEHEDGIIWSDPDLAIDWQVEHDAALVSDKDRALPPLARLDTPFD